MASLLPAAAAAAAAADDMSSDKLLARNCIRSVCAARESKRIETCEAGVRALMVHTAPSVGCPWLPGHIQAHVLSYLYYVSEKRAAHARAWHVTNHGDWRASDEMFCVGPPQLLLRAIEEECAVLRSTLGMARHNQLMRLHQIQDVVRKEAAAFRRREFKREMKAAFTAHLPIEQRQDPRVNEAVDALLRRPLYCL